MMELSIKIADEYILSFGGVGDIFKWHKLKFCFYWENGIFLKYFTDRIECWWGNDV